jgi:hypothetical protein
MAAALTLIAVSAGPAGSASVQTRIPVVCSVEATLAVVRLTPLVIDAAVHQKCNTQHDLNVTYRPENLSRPRLLQISLAGVEPTFNTPGSARFTNLPYQDSVQHLRISYAGPRNERELLMRTIRVGVSY